jgi:choline/glycine/proline betaine transport protein
MIERFTSKWKVNPAVFFSSVTVIFLFITVGVLFPERVEGFFEQIQAGIVANFGWLYVLSVAFFLVFIAFIYWSPYSRTKLGPDDSEPDYTNSSWFAMLFSAGMGIGLVFFSVAEPMYHFLSPPGGDGESIEAAKEAMRLTFFHWGLHAWGIYIVVGMSLAYFSFRKGLPLSIRSAFYPLLGDRIYGITGHLIDVLAIFGTMFGVATSLGLGVMQVNAGFNYLFGLEISVLNQVLLITLITLAATVSVFLGLDKGIKRLSNFNLTIAVLLIGFVFLLGPTLFIVNSLAENTGRYLQSIVETTFWVDSFSQEEGWLGSWTLFYWGWWIAWSPFVGMFIARISRGRTIREFIRGVLLVPTAFTFVWLTVFGNTGLHIEIFGDGGIAGMETETMLFGLLDAFPLSAITSFLATTVIITFFVTSSDSGSLVIDMLASGGNTNPPKLQRVFWAMSEGVVAAVLLYAGGLVALQTASITTGLPFAVVLLLICFSLHKALRDEHYSKQSRERKEYQQVITDLINRRKKRSDQ